MLYFICKVFTHDSGFSETLHSQSLSSRIKVVCLLKFFIELYVFLDCLSRSLSYCFAGCFQSCMNNTCSTLEVKLKQKWFWELLLLGVFEFLNKYFFIIVKRVSISQVLFIQALNSSHCTWHLFWRQKSKVTGWKDDFGNWITKIFFKVSAQSLLLPCNYYTEVDWPDWTVLSNSWILHIKTFDVDVMKLLCKGKGSACFDRSELNECNLEL